MLTQEHKERGELMAEATGIGVEKFIRNMETGEEIPGLTKDLGLLALVALAKREVNVGRGMSPEDCLQKMRAERNK